MAHSGPGSLKHIFPGLEFLEELLGFIILREYME